MKQITKDRIFLILTAIPFLWIVLCDKLLVENTMPEGKDGIFKSIAEAWRDGLK